MIDRTLARVTCAVLLIALIPACVFAEASLQDNATKLFQSLSDEQRAQMVLPFDSPERTSEVFPGGKRPGIPLRELTDEQQKLAMNVLTAFTSDYGREKAEAISKQEQSDPGLGRYYVCFFGEPGKDQNWAWRLAEHHLTLVHVEVSDGQAISFGPILLGANPPVLWDEEEQKMIALYAAMTEAERAAATRGGKGISSAEFEGKAVRIGDLNPSAKEAAKAVLENRLAFFADPIRQRIVKIIASQGGIDEMHLAYFGEAKKKCREGGRWDFKLGGKDFLCDYESSRGHIHMSMKGRIAR